MFGMQCLDARFRRILVEFLAVLIMVNVPLSAQPTLRHTMGIGEALCSIAQRYSTTEARIIELNPDTADFIYVGMELVIPIASPTNLAENSGNSADKKDSVTFASETAPSMPPGQTDRFSQKEPGNAGLFGSKDDDSWLSGQAKCAVV